MGKLLKSEKSPTLVVNDVCAILFPLSQILGRELRLIHNFTQITFTRTKIILPLYQFMCHFLFFESQVV